MDNIDMPQGKGIEAARIDGARHSHSMVAGGLLETSKQTRLTPRTSLMMRVEMRAEQIVGNSHPVGRHSVEALHDAESNGVFVSAFIAHYTDGLHWKQDSKGLPNLVIPAAGLHLFENNRVSVSHDPEFFGALSHRGSGRQGPGQGKAGDGRSLLATRARVPLHALHL